MICRGGLPPRPKTMSVEVVTVERSTLSRETGSTGAMPRNDTKPRGACAARSFKVASNGCDMRAPRSEGGDDRLRSLTALRFLPNNTARNPPDQLPFRLLRQVIDRTRPVDPRQQTDRQVFDTSCLQLGQGPEANFRSIPAPEGARQVEER